MTASGSPEQRFPELAEALGERYTESKFERGFYARDLAAVPPFLGRLVGRTMPDAVVRPRDARDIVELMRCAADRNVPVVPRGAATTTYWNAVPVKGGLVVDMTGLRGMVDLDEGALTATVLPGTRWEELDASLGRLGYATLSYPTSAPAATVGGWLNMEGYGIGSLRYGSLAAQVREVSAVLPGGPAADPQPQLVEPELFAGSEGTLGIVTQLKLRVRRRPEAMGHHLVACPDVSSLAGLLEALAASEAAEARPIYAHFADPAYGRLMAAAGCPPADPRPVLAFTYQGTAAEVAAGERAAAKAISQWRCEPLLPALAAREWEERFMALRLKRGGPTVLGAEAWLPLDSISAYQADVARLAARQRLEIATYGTAVAPRWATVMSIFPCDESRPVPYVLALSLTNALYRIAFRHGGRPYGIGVWSTPYLGRVPAEELAGRWSTKQRLDPLGRMNPGKAYAAPLLLSPALFGPAMAVLAAARGAAARMT